MRLEVLVARQTRFLSWSKAVLFVMAIRVRTPFIALKYTHDRVPISVPSLGGDAN